MMIEALKKPVVCVDLDGVLAGYDKWRGVNHIGEPIKGARDFMDTLRRSFRVLVWTTRNNPVVNHDSGETQEQLSQRVRNWLDKHRIPHDGVVANQAKPLCIAFIDDRAITARPQENPHAYQYAVRQAMRLKEKCEWGDAQVDAANNDLPT